MSQNYFWPPSGSGSNPSVGVNGAAAPSDSTQIAGVNGTGKLTPVSVDASGNINVNVENFPGGTLDTNLTKVGGAAITEGQKTMANSLPIVIASDQSAITVAQATAANLNATVVQGTASNLLTQVSQPTAASLNATVVQGTASLLNATVVQGTASNLKTSSNVNDGSGNAITSTSSALDVNLKSSTGLGTIVTSDLADGSVTGGAAGTKSILAGGQFNTVLPTITNTQQAAIQLDSSARPIIAPLTSSSTVTVVQPTGTNLHAVLDSGSTTAVTQATAANLNATVVQATGSNLHTVIDSGTLTTVSTVTAVTAITNALPAGTNNIGSVSTAGTIQANAPIFNDYTSTSITTSAYVQLVASTSNAINTIHIFDSSGQTMIFAIGGAGAEVDQLYVQPGGDVYSFAIPVSTRISYKAKTATASTGYLIMSFLK